MKTGRSLWFHKFAKYGVLVVALALLLPGDPIAAQRATWTVPVQLNEENGALPDIVVDTQGDIHVFWSSVGEEPGGIFHTMLSQQGWSVPNDVLVSPNSSAASWPRAVVDSQGFVHLVWVGDVVYYSNAPEKQVDQARAWSVPQILSTGQATSPNIRLDTAGRLHVVYVDIYHAPYVRHTLSEDGGITWSQPVVVSAPTDGAVAINAQLAIDSNDVLHVVWSETIEDFPPSGVYYARSSDRGETWTYPYPIASGGYSWASIGVDASGDVHVFWTGTGQWAGKYHCWSSDGGANWTPAVRVWSGSAGFLGFANLFVDGDGAFHVVAPASDPNADVLSSGEIFHAVWDRGDWIDTENISTGNWLRRRENQMPRVAVDGDNSVHVVWQMQNPNEAAEPLVLIWYSTTSDRQESILLSSDSSSQSLPAPHQTPITHPGVLTPSLEDSEDTLLLPEAYAPQDYGVSASAFVLPIISAGVLVMAVVLVARQRRTK